MQLLKTVTTPDLTYVLYKEKKPRHENNQQNKQNNNH